MKLMMDLKQGHDPVSLIGSISKMIHELTEDTRTLSDIKQRLDLRRPESAAEETYPRPSDSSMSYDMPLQKALQGNMTQVMPANLRNINFVQEDG